MVCHSRIFFTALLLPTALLCCNGAFASSTSAGEGNVESSTLRNALAHESKGRQQPLASTAAPSSPQLDEQSTDDAEHQEHIGPKENVISFTNDADDDDGRSDTDGNDGFVPESSGNNSKRRKKSSDYYYDDSREVQEMSGRGPGDDENNDGNDDGAFVPDDFEGKANKRGWMVRQLGGYHFPHHNAQHASEKRFLDKRSSLFRFPVSKNHVEHFRRAPNGQAFPESLESQVATLLELTAAKGLDGDNRGSSVAANDYYYPDYENEDTSAYYSPVWGRNRHQGARSHVKNMRNYGQESYVPSMPVDWAARFLGRPYQSWEPKSNNIVSSFTHSWDKKKKRSEPTPSVLVLGDSSSLLQEKRHLGSILKDESMFHGISHLFAPRKNRNKQDRMRKRFLGSASAGPAREMLRQYHQSAFHRNRNAPSKLAFTADKRSLGRDTRDYGLDFDDSYEAAQENDRRVLATGFKKRHLASVIGAGYVRRPLWKRQPTAFDESAAFGVNGRDDGASSDTFYDSLISDDGVGYDESEGATQQGFQDKYQGQTDYSSHELGKLSNGNNHFEANEADQDGDRRHGLKRQKRHIGSIARMGYTPLVAAFGGSPSSTSTSSFRGRYDTYGLEQPTPDGDVLGPIESSNAISEEQSSLSRGRGGQRTLEDAINDLSASEGSSQASIEEEEREKADKVNKVLKRVLGLVQKWVKSMGKKYISQYDENGRPVVSSPSSGELLPTPGAGQDDRSASVELAKDSTTASEANSGLQMIPRTDIPVQSSGAYPSSMDVSNSGNNRVREVETKRYLIIPTKNKVVFSSFGTPSSFRIPRW